jgi:Ner family transcriptional regulator
MRVVAPNAIRNRGEKVPRTDMHPADVMAALKKRGISMRKLSLRAGKNDSAVAQAVKNPVSSIPMELLVADALGMKPEKIWPSRYYPSGKPRPRMGKKAPTAFRRNARSGNAA